MDESGPDIQVPAVSDRQRGTKEKRGASRQTQGVIERCALCVCVHISLWFLAFSCSVIMGISPPQKPSQFTVESEKYWLFICCLVTS